MPICKIDLVQINISNKLAILNMEKKLFLNQDKHCNISSAWELQNATQVYSFSLYSRDCWKPKYTGTMCIPLIVTIYFQGWLKTSQLLPDTKWFDHIEGNLRFFPCMSADLGWVSKMFATTSKFTMLAYELAIQFCN